MSASYTTKPANSQALKYPIMPTSTHQTHRTSAQALDAMTNKQRKGLQGAILNILLLATERGVTDMTTKEIARQHEENMGGVRCEPSSFTQPVQMLLAAKLIERVPEQRECRISTHPAAPLRLTNLQDIE